MVSPKLRKTGLRCIVVGAGLAGLTAARLLVDRGQQVVVVDKSRDAGGRMSTRRKGTCRFDHGAQYFTVSDARFMRQVLGWRKRGWVQSWNARIGVVSAHRIEAADHSVERFVAVPAMNAICRELVQETGDCRFGWNVRSVAHDGDHWRATSTAGAVVEGDVLILAIPPEQARSLLKDAAVHHALRDVEMRPSWALMLELDRPLLPEWDAAFINQGPLSWIASQASKPGRPENHAWVLHATPEWSTAHLGEHAQNICELLLHAARKLPSAQPFGVRHAQAHRWRYAVAGKPLDQGVLWFEAKRLALAGDWCHGSRVEGAFLSGVATAERILSAG